MQDIHDIRLPVPIGMDPVILWVLLGIVLAIIVIGLIIVLVRKWLKQKAASPPVLPMPTALPPYQIAMKCLDDLLLKHPADPRLFYFELSMVLRQYLDARFGCHTKEMTSQQFVKILPGMGLERTIQQEISHLIKTSEPIKYGGLVPDSQQVKNDIKQVKTWVAQIENQIENQRNKEKREIREDT